MSQPEVEPRAPDLNAPVHRVPHRHAATLSERLGRHVVLYGVVLVVLQLGFRAWALAGSWFYFDDIAFMSRAMNQPLDASYLLESYGGHLMPGGFLAVYALTKLADRVTSHGGSSALRFFVSAHASLEELFLIGRLGGAFGLRQNRRRRRAEDDRHHAATGSASRPAVPGLP